jgi:DNA-binding response OmpR family regulator
LALRSTLSVRSRGEGYAADKTNEGVEGLERAMPDAMTRTIDMHISSLRKELDANSKYRKLILTVAKVGYKLAGSKNT